MTKVKTSSREKGFSLIEILVVMAIAVAMAGMAMAWYSAENERQMKASAITSQAMEMSVMAASLEAYLSTKPASVPTDGTAIEVTAGDLADAGYLPKKYAKVNGEAEGTAHSPLGRQYVIKARVVAGKYQGVVYAAGAPRNENLAVAGMNAQPESLLEFDMSVLKRLKSEHLASAGIISVGSQVTDYEASGFEIDLTNYLGGPLAQSTVAVLAGHKELRALPPLEVDVSGGGTGSPGAPSPISTEGRACYMNTTTGDCNAGYEKVWEYTACQRWGTDFPNEPATTSVSIGGNVINITKSVTSSGSSLHNPPQTATNHYYSDGGRQHQAVAYDSFCPSGYYTHILNCSDGGWNSGSYCPANGAWGHSNYKPGASCSYLREGSKHLQYNAGLTEGNSGATALYPSYRSEYTNIWPPNATDQAGATLIRSLPVCPGSTFAIPVPVFRWSGGGKWAEWMSVLETSFASNNQERTWNETVAGAGVNVSVACQKRVLSNSPTVTLATGVTATNACGNVVMPDHNPYGGRKYQLFNYVTPSEQRKKFAFCCATN